MSTRTKSAPVARRAAPAPSDDTWSTAPPQTTAERLLRIEALGRKITEHIRFMCAIGHLNGSSTEAKDNAVTLFYNRLVGMEQELSRIQQELQLG